MTFHFPTSDIINTTVGQNALTIGAGDTVLIASDIHVIDTNPDSVAIDGSDASGARITVQGTVAAATYGIMLAFGPNNDNNLVTVAEGGYVEASAGIFTWGDGNVVNVLGEVVGSAVGVSQIGDATSTNILNVSGSVVSGGLGLDLTNGVQRVTNTGLIQGGYTAGLFSKDQTLHLSNAGTIAGTGGIALEGTDAVIVNSGSIVGAEYGAITIHTEGPFETVAHRQVSISNEGTIAGAKGIWVIPYVSSLSDVTLTVRNSGTISGDVIFDRGNDLYDGALGTLHGTLAAGAGHDTLLGGAGNETFLGGAGLDSLDGGAGRDSLDGGDNDDSIFGGEGDDTLLGGAGVDQMDGGAGNDGMAGGDGIDVMTGGTGNDFMLGQAGNDTIDGGADNDTLQGGDDADLMKGGAGDDLLQGQAGADEIDGGEGNDTVNGGAGADSMDGGAGVDLLSYQGAGGAVNVNLGTGETVGGEAIFDIFTGFEQLEGSGFNDILTGSAAADTIWGGNGDDQILGGNGNDVLRGGDGLDILTGGAGRDVLIGGAGIDHFRFTDLKDFGKAAGSRDIIRDFQSTVDKIDLSLIDPIAGGADDAFVFRAGNAFTGTGVAEVRFVSSGNDTMIQLDADGNGTFDAAFLINGAGVPLASDFFL